MWVLWVIKFGVLCQTAMLRFLKVICCCARITNPLGVNDAEGCRYAGCLKLFKVQVSRISSVGFLQ
jgi:hypothetical protein